MSARSGWRAEVCSTLELLEREIDDLVVRGLSACGPADIKTLESAADALGKAGAMHVAGRISDVVQLQRGGDKGASRALLQLMTSLRVFERVLTLEAVHELLTGNDPDAKQATQTAAPAAAGTKSALAPADEKKLLPVLDDLALAVEDLVASGLVTASKATREKLDVSFKEASRLKLGRLAASLRYVTEELQRYLDGAATFSGKRLALFLCRSWILGRGMSLAITERNEAALSRLLLTMPAVVVDKVEIVTLGVRKRVPIGTGIVAFDFHMRLVTRVELQGGHVLEAGAPLIWSHVMPRKEAAIAAEAMLHLEIKPQAQAGGSAPQGFKPITLAEPKVFTFENVAVSPDGRGGGRLTLGPKSSLKAGARYEKSWAQLASFDAEALARRVHQHQVTPLDLEVELAEEVALDGADVGKPEKNDDDTADRVALSARGLWFEVPLARTEETKELKAGLKKKSAAPLFGVVHFDRCRLMFQPLSVLESSGPRHLMLSMEKVDLKQLTKSLF